MVSRKKEVYTGAPARAECLAEPRPEGPDAWPLLWRATCPRAFVAASICPTAFKPRHRHHARLGSTQLNLFQFLLPAVRAIMRRFCCVFRRAPSCVPVSRPGAAHHQVGVGLEPVRHHQNSDQMAVRWRDAMHARRRHLYAASAPHQGARPKGKEGDSPARSSWLVRTHPCVRAGPLLRIMPRTRRMGVS